MISNQDIQKIYKLMQEEKHSFLPGFNLNFTRELLPYQPFIQIEKYKVEIVNLKVVKTEKEDVYEGTLFINDQHVFDFKRDKLSLETNNVSMDNQKVLDTLLEVIDDKFKTSDVELNDLEISILDYIDVVDLVISKILLLENEIFYKNETNYKLNALYVLLNQNNFSLYISKNRKFCIPIKTLEIEKEESDVDYMKSILEAFSFPHGMILPIRTNEEIDLYLLITLIIELKLTIDMVKKRRK